MKVVDKNTFGSEKASVILAEILNTEKFPDGNKRMKRKVGSFLSVYNNTLNTLNDIQDTKIQESMKQIWYEHNINKIDKHFHEKVNSFLKNIIQTRYNNSINNTVSISDRKDRKFLKRMGLINNPFVKDILNAVNKEFITPSIKENFLKEYLKKYKKTLKEFKGMTYSKFKEELTAGKILTDEHGNQVFLDKNKTNVIYLTFEGQRFVKETGFDEEFLNRRWK